MKKIGIMLALLGLLTISCDPTTYYDYYIINNCDEDINVDITDYKNNNLIITIKAGAEQFVYQGEDFSFLEYGIVEYFFKNIIITKDNDTSEINYVDKDLWIVEATSKVHANNYLTVNSKDFE